MSACANSCDMHACMDLIIILRGQPVESVCVAAQRQQPGAEQAPPSDQAGVLGLLVVVQDGLEAPALSFKRITFLHKWTTVLD